MGPTAGQHGFNVSCLLGYAHLTESDRKLHKLPYGVAESYIDSSVSHIQVIIENIMSPPTELPSVTLTQSRFNVGTAS